MMTGYVYAGCSLGLLYALTITDTLTQTGYVYAGCSLGLLYASYAIWVFIQVYMKEFAGKRLSREHDKCPTSVQLDPPDVKNWKHNQHRVLENSKHHPANFATCELLNDVKIADHDKKIHRKTRDQSSQKTKASVLNMDHIYISYPQLLWVYTFIGPLSYFLWMKGVIFLQIRIFLVKKGLVEKKPVDMEALVGKLVLEQSQAIHYFARTSKTSKLGNIAGFFFADFPYVDHTGKMKVANLFAVDIDLETRTMVKCKMDDEHLTASEALILSWYNTIAAQHVKLHAFGNWGVNVDEDARKVNPFLHTNSLVTVAYNYFGFTSFKRFFDIWKKQGLLSQDWDPAALTQSFVHGVQENIWQHSHIVALEPHSDFVRFVTKTRTIFHAEFVKYKHLFPGINAEGLFVGTVLHSLDHALMEWNLEDPLWLDVDHPKYGKMAELGRIVRVGFVPEVPGYYFHRHFRGSGHPFYKSVYAKAAKVNKKFADHMDTCICR